MCTSTPAKDSNNKGVALARVEEWQEAVGCQDVYEKWACLILCIMWRDLWLINFIEIDRAVPLVSCL